MLSTSPLGDLMARPRDLLQLNLAVVISLGLSITPVCVAPATAATPEPARAAAANSATVVSAQRAHVGSASASVGTTIFSGDNLDTDKLGNLQVRAGAARLLLASASRATWGAEADVPAATLNSGSATFSTANAKAFALRAGTAMIRPTGDEPSIGNVAMLNPKELTVHCTRGSLTLTVIDDSLLIPEGMAAHILLDPDPKASPEPQKTWGGQPPRRSGRNRFLFIWIAAAGAVTAFAVYKALESPDRP
jgi:hypothetical protein